MTDTISKAAKAKALELAIQVCRELKPEAVGDSYLNPGCFDPDDCSERTWEGIALARVLQEHSDKAKRISAYIDAAYLDEIDSLQSMILPDDPEPLEEAMNAVMGGMGKSIRPQLAADIRQALDAAGYEIRRKDV